MAAYDLVIFDNDGVLVDSEPLTARVRAEFLTEHGYPITAEECLQNFLGMISGQVYAVIAERTGQVLPEEFHDRYLARLFAAFDSELAAVPGVVEVLEQLDDAGISYCVVSNSHHQRIRRGFQAAGLLERFTGRMFSAQDVSRPKPAPDLFLHAAATLGVEPERCVVIEDSPRGVTAASSAGMAVYGYADTTSADQLTEADHVVTSMTELPPLLIG